MRIVEILERLRFMGENTGSEPLFGPGEYQSIAHFLARFGPLPAAYNDGGHINIYGVNLPDTGVKAGEHVIYKCRQCGVVVTECVCSVENKVIKWATCNACKGLN